MAIGKISTDTTHRAVPRLLVKVGKIHVDVFLEQRFTNWYESVSAKV